MTKMAVAVCIFIQKETPWLLPGKCIGWFRKTHPVNYLASFVIVIYYLKIVMFNYL